MPLGHGALSHLLAFSFFHGPLVRERLLGRYLLGTRETRLSKKYVQDSAWLYFSLSEASQTVSEAVSVSVISMSCGNCQYL